jgi:metal-dependent amidase/aminoacylase/carboxypeptidase family protein
VTLQRAAVVSALGIGALTETEQSMGGEDFAWYLDRVPGALVRLGVRRAGSSPFDLHQGTFDIDEDALAVGVQYTVALVRTALQS